MANATCEVMWMLSSLREFGVSHEKLATLFCDNKAALYIATNSIYHERTLHIKIDCHLIREKLHVQVFVKSASRPIYKTSHTNSVQNIASQYGCT